ncbi:22137_t:CDS:2 [Rhizophagus irregularis]|nr:22137_t:CDS:2 [Rhizophagus irregularis]
MSSIITDNLSSTFHSPISWSIYTESPESSPTNNKFPSYSPIQYSSEEEIDVDYSCPKFRKIIANNYLNEKHGITNLPYKVRKVKRLSQITSHPEAVFTSRLLNYSNLPQPLDAPDISEENNNESSHTYSELKSKFADFEIELKYSSYYSSSDEEQDEEENKIEENEENEESNYVTRAFDETLSFGGVPKVSSKKQISSEPVLINKFFLWLL